MRQNFPDIDLAPWTILERFGPTPSGAEGFTVTIPEMDKVTDSSMSCITSLTNFFRDFTGRPRLPWRLCH
jgi:hypothetical protein